ncbi:MAG: transposase [Bacteroidota bacterium]
MPDHVHCLFLLSKQKSISEVIKQVKGSSSHFINEQKMLPLMFAWQNGYAAFPVSEQAISKTYQYIKNQKSRHAEKQFDAEYDMLLRMYGFNPEK